MKFRIIVSLLSGLLVGGCASSSITNKQTPSANADKTPVYFRNTPDDSGMWLLPQVKDAVYTELQKKGLHLPPDSIYNLSHPSLNQAVVRIDIAQSGGGTGSFVSDKGLILTNHHVAYDAIASASSVNNNYLEQGFYAEALTQEIPVKNYSLYIPIEQSEVTSRIDSLVPDDASRIERLRAEQQARRQLITERKKNNSDLVVEIDDFWAGNRQFMSVYKIIRDVRLVYAPPSSIGNYGGEVDNWQWPRHTGDYAFLRAYIAPDGTSREYHEQNTPFKPSKHLSINAAGLHPSDFTMVLGFPGETFRHQSSYAFNYYKNVQHPIMISSLKAILDAMELTARQDSLAAVANAPDRASLSNTIKYLQGVKNGFEKYNIIDRKRRQESAFKKWVESDSVRYARYGRVLSQLDQAFDIASQTGDLLYATFYPLNNNALIQIAGLYDPYFEYLQHPDSLSFSQARKDSLLSRHQQLLGSVNIEAQNLMLKQMLQIMSSFPPEKRMLYLIELFEEKENEELKRRINVFLTEQSEESIVYDPAKARTFLELPVDEAAGRPVDSMIMLQQEIRQTFEFSRQNYINHFAYLNPARRRYVDGMLSFRDDSTEYSDANSTLRLSGGRVRGYSPSDGIYYTSYTTFNGMIAKDTDREPFDAPQQLEEYDASGDSVSFGRRNTQYGHIITNFLTTNDITGGNSGSPVMNGNGELVGLAFDSNYEGMVGDYYFDPELKRTISVDIRYILFLMEEFSKTDRLLNELHIIHKRTD